MSALAGRVFVLLETGAQPAAELGRLLAEAGASTITVHGHDQPPGGRGLLAGDPSNPLDVDAATAMATELFGPVDAVLDLSSLPADPEAALAALHNRFGSE
jgi:hypothetical protein